MAAGRPAARGDDEMPACCVPRSGPLGDDGAPALDAARQALILEYLQRLLRGGLGHAVLLGQARDRRERVTGPELAGLDAGAQLACDDKVGRLARALVVCHMINAN